MEMPNVHERSQKTLMKDRSSSLNKCISKRNSRHFKCKFRFSEITQKYFYKCWLNVHSIVVIIVFI
jgi:hypothetical protein